MSFNIIKGLGREEPIKADGSGTKLPYRFDLIPPHPLFGIARVYAEGYEKYARCPDHLHTQGTQGPPKDCKACATMPNSGWVERVTAEDHANHIMTHLQAFLAGDISDDHLDHLGCRVTMLMERVRRDKLKKEATQAYKDCTVAADSPEVKKGDALTYAELDKTVRKVESLKFPNFFDVPFGYGWPFYTFIRPQDFYKDYDKVTKIEQGPTVTGRFSCNTPNAQDLPFNKVTVEGTQVKQDPCSPGYTDSPGVKVSEFTYCPPSLRSTCETCQEHIKKAELQKKLAQEKEELAQIAKNVEKERRRDVLYAALKSLDTVQLLTLLGNLARKR